MGVNLTTLDNGLRIVTRKRDNLRTVTLGIWFGVGSRNESASENGISHFLEHMAFKGTSSHSARELAEVIEAVGGDLNAATGIESTCYCVRLMSEDVELGMRMISEIITDSTFDPKEIDREKHVILQEISAAEDTPEDLAFTTITKLAFNNQPIGRNIMGDHNTVNSFNRDSLANFLGRFYVNNNAVISAVGRVDHDQIVDWARHYFSGLSSGSAPKASKAKYIGGLEYIERDLEQIHVVLGFEGVSYHDPSYYAVQLLSTVLGNGWSSRLFQKIREEMGLSYSISSFHFPYFETGLFGVYAATDVENLHRLLEAMCKELATITEGITREELARAVAMAKVGLFEALESSSANAEQLARQTMLFGGPRDVDEIIKKIARVTPTDLTDAAFRVFHGSPLSMSLVGPKVKSFEYDQVVKMLKQKTPALNPQFVMPG